MNTFEALGEPTRRKILDILREGELPVGALVAQLDLSQPAVSKHLKVLRDTGLVTARVDAQRRTYRLNPVALADIDQWLESFRGFWTHKLDQLEGHLDSRTDEEKE